MYKYKLNLKERDEKRAQFQEKRIAVFQEIEKRLNSLYPLIDKAKDETKPKSNKLNQIKLNSTN